MPTASPAPASLAARRETGEAKVQQIGYKTGMNASAQPDGQLLLLDSTRPYPVLDHARGAYVWDTAGKRYLDAIAGIAVVNLGYGRDEIVDAIDRQARRLPFTVANTFLNEPALELASMVAELAPDDLDYVHFSSGGSEAIELALKLTRQYHVECGRPEKSIFISRWTSYHGATLAALSLTGSRSRRAIYEPLLIDFPHIEPCYCFRCPFDLSFPACSVKCATELDRVIQSIGPDRVAGFVAEPIVASVGGAIGTPTEYFPMIREICDRYDVLLVADEIVTGFGRSGKNFAMEHSEVVPDLLVMGKGMSGGYAPLAGVALRAHVHHVLARPGTTVEHVFTYGGNPISAAAGVAALSIFARERILEHVTEIAPYLREALETLRRFTFVGDVRCSGLMAAMEFVVDKDAKTPFPVEAGFAQHVQRTALSHGVVVYPGTGMADGKRGDIISLYPPLNFTRSHVDELVSGLEASFSEIETNL